MDKEYHQPSLYKNSSLTLFESYIAIEKFIIDTRLSFIDQYKLFDLLKKLLPNEDNHLTCQGFLSWLVWRVDQHEEQQHQQEEQQQQQQQRQSITDKRLHHERMISENVQVNKKLKTNGTSPVVEPYNDACLVQYAQRQLEHNLSESSGLTKKFIISFNYILLHI
ncbi:unnamed protein product [Rotaria sp. Silwood2]|nr:unnamed protein product [Rotaria sp. Silwood2]